MVTDKDKNSDFSKVMPRVFSTEDEITSKENTSMTTGGKEGGKKPFTDEKEVCGICLKCGNSTETRLPESPIVLCIHLLGKFTRKRK